MRTRVLLKKHKNFSILLVIMLVFSSIFISYPVKSGNPSSKNKISYKIYFEKPVLTDIKIENETFTQVNIQNCVSHGSLGDPCLPFYTSKILIPQGKQVKNIEVNSRRSRTINCNLIEKPVVPEQKSLPYSIDGKDSFIINDTLYNSTEPVKDEIFTNGEIGYCRGFEILTLYLHPVFYVPKNGILRYYPIIEVTINLEDKSATLSSHSNSFLRLTNEDISFVGSLVDNPEEIGSYSPPAPLGGIIPLGYESGLCDPADSYDYVIITSQSLKDTTGYPYNWSDLISHRQSYSGLTGTIVTVEEIEACSSYFNTTPTFNDSQARIREFCKDAYQDWGTSYILLGGDWDNDVDNQIVPFRLFTDRFETNPYDTMACDKYFSHLDGDWYFTSQGIWGGGRLSGVNDLYGELNIGRITAVDAETVSNAVNKIINYDTNVSLSDSWYSSAAFCGGNLGWDHITSKDYMEEIRLGSDTYRTFTGFEEWNSEKPLNQIDTTVRLYDKDLGGSYSSLFDSSIENDEFAMITHIDHSSWNTPFGLPNWQYRINSKPFFGITEGCLAGRFHSGFAGCEQMICRHADRHAYALVLNTGYGYGNGYSTDGASQYITSFFWDYFFNNQSDNLQNWQLGKAMAYALDKMGAIINSNPAAWCYAWYSAHLFGDPAQCIRLSSNNNEAQLSSENPSDSSIDVSIGLTTLSVDIQDPDGHKINWTIETVPDIGSNSGQNENNGIKTCAVSNLDYSTSYSWYINASDGYAWTNSSYQFTTCFPPPNYPPEFSNLSIANGSTHMPLNISQLSFTIKDHEGELFNYSIETVPEIGNKTANLEENGTKFVNISNLTYNTTYIWFVNASDGNSNSSEWYSFKTRPTYTPQIPSNFNAIANNRFQIDLSWNDDSYSDSTIIEWHTSEDSSWEIGDHTQLYNGTAGEVSQNDLNPGTTIYYKSWSWNETDNVWSNGAVVNQTSKHNYLPEISSPNPGNISTGQMLSFNWSIIITDPDGDSFNWTVESSSGHSNSSNDDVNGTKSIFLSQLRHNTYYTIWVNATDSYGWSKKWYLFFTLNYAEPAAPGDFYAEAVGRYQISLSWTRGDNSNYTYIEYNTSQGPWNFGEANKIYNGTDTNYNHTDLSAGSTIYYQAWSWNDSQNNWSVLYDSASATTDINNAPIVTSISPTNGSIDVSESTSSISFTINDSEGDRFSWSIETYPDIGSNFQNNDNNGTKTLTIDSLDYSITYHIFINSTDGNSTKNESFSFTVKDDSGGSQSNQNNQGSGQTTENVQPTADAGGPYSGYVNEEINFDGSSSSDSDGMITDYNWDFGDGSTSTGAQPTHIYSALGTFTITLTVQDNMGSTNTDSTTITITTENIDNESNGITTIESNASEEDTYDQNSNGIPDIIEDEFGLNVNDSSALINIQISDKICYLIDIDSDGKIDKYFNPETGEKSNTIYIGAQKYLIDTNCDGTYEYTYNFAENSINEIALKQINDGENSISYLLILIVLSIISIIVIAIISYKKH